MHSTKVLRFGEPKFSANDIIFWKMLLCIVVSASAGAAEKDALTERIYESKTVAAEASSNDALPQTEAGARVEIGFASPRSVEGMLTETAERQREGPLAKYRARKERLEGNTGLAYGFDNNTLYLDTDSDNSPSDAASNVTRFYGTWAATGLGTPDVGALVFKLEYRTAIGGHVSAQVLGPLLGYAGLLASTYSDAGLVLTNLYWRQRFFGGRGGFVIGQVDTYDYVNVNNLASPWDGFTNLAFEQQPTFAGPAPGLGAALLWQLNDNWAVLGGLADANADPSEPWNSARTLFDTGETFKHLAFGWSPDWGNRYNQLVQLTFWQLDARAEAGAEGGHGVAFAASARFDQWRPFLRAGHAEDGGVSLDRSFSVGFGYDSRGGNDLAGLGVSWGRAPDDSRNQYTLEAFYRYDVTDFIQFTPSVQYAANPANDLESGDVLVFGVRLRAYF